MRLTLTQEEILLALKSLDCAYSNQITQRINKARPKSWGKIKQTTVATTLKRMVCSNLVVVSHRDYSNYNKVFYAVSLQGHKSLLEIQQNRRSYDKESVNLK